LITKS